MRGLLAIVTLVAIGSIPAAAGADWPSDYRPHETVATAHRALVPQVLSCWKSHTTPQAREHGDVVSLKLTVSESGSVFRVDFLESSYRSKAFEKCVRDAFTATTYPGGNGAKMVLLQRLGFQNSGVTLDPPRAAGGKIDVDSVTQMARARQADFQRCYETALANNPDLRGRLLVEVIVDSSSGQIASAKIAARTISAAGLDACVLGVVETFRFPPPSDPSGLVIVKFPLTFDDDATVGQD